MVVEVDKKQLKRKINQVVKTKMIEYFAFSSAFKLFSDLGPTRIVLAQKKNVFTVFRTIGHRRWWVRRKSSLTQRFLFLLFSIIITKNFTLIQANGKAVIIDRNIYLRLFFCFRYLHFHSSLSRSNIVKLWKNVNIFE